MTIIFGKKIENGTFEEIIKFCKDQKIKQFEPERCLKIRELGKGGFGEVWMCYDLLEDERVAVKYTKIKEIKNKNEKLNYIYSFMRERLILEKTKSKKDVDSISKFFGSYYLINDEAEIESLILVSESGDYNLESLLQERINRKIQNNLPAYSDQEVIDFLFQISEGYKALQELGIYHSDTKALNLVFSKTKKKFIIIDFGHSRLIDNLEESELDRFGSAGTPRYCSPEKREYWKWTQLNKNNGNDQYPAEKNKFNPFKCDMWSLGIILEKMMCLKGGIDNKKPYQHELLQYILEKLKETDWNKRFDAIELHNLLCEKKDKSLISKQLECSRKRSSLLEN